jgi:16S rRNA (cytidine1402-2'-O)-methyltransferase
MFESPRRLAACLADAADMLGAERQGAVCRELTKKFEEVQRGTLQALAVALAERTVKGEIVLLIERGKTQPFNASQTDLLLKEALSTLSVKDAAAQVAEVTGQKKRDVYQRALALVAQAKGEDDAGSG